MPLCLPPPEPNPKCIESKSRTPGLQQSDFPSDLRRNCVCVLVNKPWQSESIGMLIMSRINTYPYPKCAVGTHNLGETTAVTTFSSAKLTSSGGSQRPAASMPKRQLRSIRGLMGFKTSGSKNIPKMGRFDQKL